VIRYTTMASRPQAAVNQEPFHHYRFEDGTVWTEFYRSNDGYLLRFPGLVDFEVSADGTEVIAHPAEDTDEVTVEHLYINQMVPLALSRQGRPAFHASVVAVAGGTVAFLGSSGMGKSTLAASFALNGAAFLTDDALIVEEADENSIRPWDGLPQDGRELENGVRVLPSHASLRLWEDSVEALVGAENPRAMPISYSTKARLLAGEALAYSEDPQPLLAAYVLETQNALAVSIKTLTGLDRYMAWLGNSFLLDIEDHELLARHFEWTHRISGAVPTFALDYPRDYGILRDVQTAVRRHVANPGN
jgi:hypothetical protein